AGKKFNNVRAAPTAGYNGIALSRKSYCGIFGGYIKSWNDPSLTADNKGKQLAPGVASAPITVIYRAEKVSTTTQLTAHLAAVCSSTPYPFPTTPSSDGFWPGAPSSNNQTYTLPSNFVATPLPAFGGIAGEVDYIGDGSATFPGTPGSI